MRDMDKLDCYSLFLVTREMKNKAKICPNGRNYLLSKELQGLILCIYLFLRTILKSRDKTLQKHTVKKDTAKKYVWYFTGMAQAATTILVVTNQS